MKSTRWVQLGHGWRVRLEVKLSDFWVGVFWKWDRERLWANFDLWVCVAPCLPLHFASEFPPRELK